MPRKRTKKRRPIWHPEWPFRLKPRLYLLRFPDGEHAELARNLLWRKRGRTFREHFDESLAAAIAAYEVLVRKLGRYLHDESDSSEDRYSLHYPVRLWLQKQVPFTDETVRPGEHREYRRRRVLAQRQFIRRLGVRIEHAGQLGNPPQIPVRPEFWPLKQTPKHYTWGRGGGPAGSRTRFFLAMAALAPFEDRIDGELLQVARSLQTHVASETPSAVTERVFLAAVEEARIAIVQRRYGGQQSLLHFLAVKKWIEKLQLEEEVPEIEWRPWRWRSSPEEQPFPG